MTASRPWVIGTALTLLFGIGFVYWGIAFILGAAPNVNWELVWQLPYGIVTVTAGLLLYGGAVWRTAARHAKTTSEAAQIR